MGKVVIHKIEGHGWFIRLKSEMGIVAGKTKYETKEDAIEAARKMHGDKHIEVEE